MTIDERATRSRATMLRYMKTPPILSTIDHAMIDYKAEMMQRYRVLTGGWNADIERTHAAAQRWVARKKEMAPRELDG